MLRNKLVLVETLQVWLQIGFYVQILWLYKNFVPQWLFHIDSLYLLEPIAGIDPNLPL